jgi:hypothetical protein
MWETSGLRKTSVVCTRCSNLGSTAACNRSSRAVFFLLLMGCTAGVTQEHELPNEAVYRVRTYFERELRSPYLGQSCEGTTYPKWEGLPLQKCRYSVTDKDGSTKSATVILLIPSAERLARWVVHACMEVKGSADARCIRKLSKRIIGQSGGQFPVAGIVLEDQLPKDTRDGVYEAYAFRDGVTVCVHGLRNGSTLQPTDEQINEALVGPVKCSGIYARVQGTTREEYKANGGTVDVGDSIRGHRKLSWLEVSRELLKSAWNKDRNELLIAWARSNLK